MPSAQDTPQTNGSTEYGNNVVNALKKEEKIEKASFEKLSKEQEHVLQTFRLLISDLCQQFNGGHPGWVQSSVEVLCFTNTRAEELLVWLPSVLLYGNTLCDMHHTRHHTSTATDLCCQMVRSHSESTVLTHLLTKFRPHMSFPVFFPPPYWLQEHDHRPTEVLSL